MEYLTEDDIEKVEAQVIYYLKKFGKGNLEEIYAQVRHETPYFLLKDVLFAMFKKNTLRRKLARNEPTEYRLTSDYPDFGRPYKKPYRGEPKEGMGKRDARCCVDSNKENSKVYELNMLLRNVRGD